MAAEISGPAARDEAFQVPTWIHLLGGFINRHPELSIAAGNVESSILRERIDAIRIDRPIYIAGLARSGTTILLEILAAHPAVATHRYRDFPPIFTPYAWNWWLGRMPRREMTPVERTHNDGILVTADSPEAMEEVIWMAFFPHLHDPSRTGVLDASVDAPRFEAFYRDHIRKLILARGGQRYASKENYNLTRLEYLLKLFPDARFIIPIRRPAGHIASLIKQHRMLAEGQRRQPRSLAHFQRVGHYEFGADMRPINTGDAARVAEISDLWGRGEEVRGWARYWAMVYGFVADRLANAPALRAAAMVVPFEQMCEQPEAMLSRLCEHCGLDQADFVARHAERLRAPTYYTAKFSAEDLSAIDEETAATWSRFSPA